MPSKFLTATLAGPWGPVHLAATERGVAAVEWLEDAADVDSRWRRRFGSDALEHLRATGDGDPETSIDDAALHLRVGTRALEAILAGRQPEALPAFDLSDRPVWDQVVLASVAEIPWGTTASYGEIARRIGSPRAARAVGGAVGRNPVSLLVPCHRVIAGDGTIGGYGGDAWGSRDDRLAIKRRLLAREGARLVDDGATSAGWAASGRRR
jgi:methylated-DNA-[protein]-cysteine S-methyltransferase